MDTRPLIFRMGWRRPELYRRTQGELSGEHRVFVGISDRRGKTVRREAGPESLGSCPVARVGAKRGRPSRVRSPARDARAGDSGRFFTFFGARVEPVACRSFGVDDDQGRDDRDVPVGRTSPEEKHR
jgi:hypothetical protein